MGMISADVFCPESALIGDHLRLTEASGTATVLKLVNSRFQNILKFLSD
jgi:hypothetical protein